MSSDFKTHAGLRQGEGGGLSPLLFILLMDGILKICTALPTKLHVGHINLEKFLISDGAIASDTMLIPKNENDLQQNIQY